VRVVVPAFRRGLAPAFTAFAVLALAASAARASGPLLFQHGGRATAQAGAFVGRATDAGGLDYNPAVIARLRGSHYQLGLDYTAPVDDYKSSTGSFRQEHLITESPSIYASWHLPEDYYPLAFGIGVDHRAWYRADWEAALFPGRFQNRLQRLELWSVHPVVAYQLGERWSVGAGLRYYTGKMEEGRNQFVIVPLAPSSGSFNAAVEVERNSDADVDGQSFDVGLHYGAEHWGWGLAFDTGGEVEGNGDVHYAARDVPAIPGLQQALDPLLQSGSSHQSFDLPQELRTGLYVAPSPAWNFEIDVAWTAWSSVDTTEVGFSRHLFALPAANPPQVGSGTERRDRRWDDTLSVRLGTEFRVGGGWSVSAGAAMEPSPVHDATVEPGFARGDATVLGTGITYRIRNIAFDLGYSFFQYDDRRVGGQELQHPQASSTYEAHDQVFGFSVSWGG